MLRGLWLPGTVEGWRMWNLSPTGNLTSLWFGTPWWEREAVRAHKLPATDNETCGIFAWRDWQTMLRLYQEASPYAYRAYGPWNVMGHVHLWGKVVEHERGYRAEYAYPKDLYVAPEMARHAMHLERLYRVPCYIGRPEFFDE